jgi:imidazolonepropionase-like amidohydrolase
MTTPQEIPEVLHRRLRRPVATAVLALVALGITACSSGKGKTAYVGATVFDGTGAPPILDAVIIVAEGRIEAIGTPDAVRPPRGATEIRADGKWIVPGLIDGHVHAESWALNRYLAYGVTSVRSLGEEKDPIVALRDSIEAGIVLGPRLYVAGPMVDGRRATRSGATVVRTETDARRAVDDRVLFQAAQVKIYTKINRRLLAPLLDEANAFELPVAAHLGQVDALTAARMGVASLEHMSGVVEATVSNPGRFYRAHNDFFTGWNLFERTWAALDSASLDRTARALAETGVSVVPTVALHEAFGHLADQEYIRRLDLDGVPDAVREAWDVPDLIQRARLSAADYRRFRRSRPAQDRFIRLFQRAGGTVVAGSDSPNQLLAPGASLHRELRLLVDAGLSPEGALLAATRNAAGLLRADSIGVLLPGNVADFLILAGDPLEDISNSRLIDRVVLRGTSYHPDDFRQEW